jgi:hypothetical protein
VSARPTLSLVRISPITSCHSFFVEMFVLCALIARTGNHWQLLHTKQQYTVKDTKSTTTHMLWRGLPVRISLAGGSAHSVPPAALRWKLPGRPASAPLRIQPPAGRTGCPLLLQSPNRIDGRRACPHMPPMHCACCAMMKSWTLCATRCAEGVCTPPRSQGLPYSNLERWGPDHLPVHEETCCSPSRGSSVCVGDCG